MGAAFDFILVKKNPFETFSLTYLILKIHVLYSHGVR